MKLTLVHQFTVPASASPYRLQDESGQEIVWGAYMVCTAFTMGARFPPASPISSGPTRHAPRSAMAGRGVRWPWACAYGNPGAWWCRSRQRKSHASGAAFAPFAISLWWA